MATKRAVFRPLSGDVNYVDYGGTWYRRVGKGRYHVMELMNWQEVCGSDAPPERYNVALSEVDLLAMTPTMRMDALRSCGLEGEDSELAVLAAHYQYGHKAPLGQWDGNNYLELMKEARTLSAELDDPRVHERYMQRPVNAIGSTAREYMQGDLSSAPRRYADEMRAREGEVYKSVAAFVDKAVGPETTVIQSSVLNPKTDSLKVAFSMSVNFSKVSEAEGTDDPLAYSMGYMHAMAGQGLEHDRRDLAPAYIAGYHKGVDVKAGNVQKPEWHR